MTQYKIIFVINIVKLGSNEMRSFKTELLAPCGDWDSLTAAVENGADAVYMGGKLFSARQFASNFDKDGIREAALYAHARNVNLYLTMNTLVSDGEMKKALEFLEQAYVAGIDGIIVQDIGFAGLIKKTFPDLPMHASTQMTIYNLEGIRILENLGFKRAVLARELSLDEISHISGNSDLEIEVFVHGALCVSYSGQCLMSSIIGGRSGNRGKCAQPCRLPYRVIGKDTDGKEHETKNKSYIMSPKDLCAVNLLNAITASGVKSLKIEGRMKSAEYVATVVRIYRKYLDRIEEGTGINKRDSEIEERDLKELTQIFNRGGFSEGYLNGKTGRDMISYEKPKNWGVYIGDVISFDSRSYSFKIKLEDELCTGDGIEIWNNEDESPGTVVTAIREEDKNVNCSKPGRYVWIGDIKGKIRKGDKVYKTSDKRLINYARETYSGRFQRKVNIRGSFEINKGMPAVLKVTDDVGNEVIVKGSYPVEEARNRPLSQERILEQIMKTGQTPFEFTEVDIESGNNLTMPVSEINNIRRIALEKLETKRAVRYERKMRGYTEIEGNMLNFPGNNRNRRNAIKISACFYKSIEGIDFCSIGADRVYLPFSILIKGKARQIIHKIKGNGTEIFAFIPPITRGNYDNLIKSKLEDVIDMGVDGILAGNLGTIHMAKNFKDISIMGDYSLNVFNSNSIRELAQMGLDGVNLSLELALKQIGGMRDIPEVIKEVTVYGRIPLMTSEHCPAGSLYSCKDKNLKCGVGFCEGDYQLEDRTGAKFPILRDRIDCRSTILNSNVLLLADNLDKIKSAGVDALRLNFTDESPGDIKLIIDMHHDILNESKEADSLYTDTINSIKEKGFTRGHYFRGV